MGKLIFRIWTTDKLSTELKTAMKKGNKQDCKTRKYRGVVFLNVVYKIFSNCILLKLRKKAEKTISDYHGNAETDSILVKSGLR